MGMVSRHGAVCRGRPPSAALQRLSRHRLPRVRSLPDVFGVKIASDPRASEPAERDRGYFGFLLSAAKSGAQAQHEFEAYPGPFASIDFVRTPLIFLSSRLSSCERSSNENPQS